MAAATLVGNEHGGGTGWAHLPPELLLSVLSVTSSHYQAIQSARLVCRCVALPCCHPSPSCQVGFPASSSARVSIYL